FGRRMPARPSPGVCRSATGNHAGAHAGQQNCCRLCLLCSTERLASGRLGRNREADRFAGHVRTHREAGRMRRAMRMSTTGLPTMWRFLGNALRAPLTDNGIRRPLVATYHVTSYCNLNGAYCEDFGLDKNRHMADAFLPREQAMKVVRVLRSATENVIFT